MTQRNPATFRSILIGLLGAAAVCFIVCWAELVVTTIQIAICQFAPAAIGLLLMVVLVNSLFKRLFRRLALRPHEIIIIYVMILVAALTTSRGLLERWFSTMAAVNYYATPANHWEELYFPNIPQWAVPWDVKGEAQDYVAKAFYEGLRPGAPIPWRAWTQSFFAWLVVIVSMLLSYAFLASILRRQWIDNEKLSFPLVNLPIELARGESEGRSFLANPLMWLGFALPTIVFTLNGIHRIFPSVPEIPVQYRLNQTFNAMGKPWRDLGHTTAYCSMAAVGFSYFLPAEILFSLWAFYVLLRIENITFSVFGASYEAMPLYPTSIWNGYHVMGAYLVLVGYFIRAGLPHLRRVWAATVGNVASPPDPLSFQERGRTAGDRESFPPLPQGEGPGVRPSGRGVGAVSPPPSQGGGRGVGDGGREFLPYRFAVIGLGITTAVSVYWFTKLGMSTWMAILEVLIYVFVVVVVMARSVNEAGMLMTETSFRPVDIVRMFTRVSALGPKTLTALSFADAAFTRDLRGNLLSTFLDGLKMSDLIKLDRRHLFGAIALALLVALTWGSVLHIIIPYQRGAVTLYSYGYRSNALWGFQHFQPAMETPGKYDARLPIFFSSGVLVALFLSVMRARYSWWPLAPLGFALSGSWSMIVFWFPILIAWLVKGALVRYGGMKTYIRLRPAFLGLILGEFSQAVLWATIASIWRLPAPFFPWP